MTLPVVVASVAWACGPSGYGVPETPAAPSEPTGQPVSPPSSATGSAPAQSSVPAQGPVSAPSESASGTTQGVGDSSPQAPQGPNRTSAPQAPQGPGQQGAGSGTSAPSPSGQADINARVNGSTAGVIEQGGQSVFASSAAPGQSKAKGGKDPARSSAKGTGQAASERSAAGDLWSGVTSGASSSLDSAAAVGGQSNGLSGGMVAGIAILGLGLVGITGGALLVTARRRRGAVGSQS